MERQGSEADGGGVTAPAKAVELVNGDRQAAYGHPLDNHQRIADFWTTRLRDKLLPGVRIDPHEVASMMRLVKESRLMQTPGHPDSLVDVAGYAEVERLIHQEQARRAAESDALVEELHGRNDGRTQVRLPRER